MIFFITTLCALVIIAASLLLASFRHPPKYHTDREDFQQLIRQVLSGQARYEQWCDVMHQPVRHDNTLEALRQRCLQIESRYFSGRDGELGRPERMVRPQGLLALEQVLAQLDR